MKTSARRPAGTHAVITVVKIEYHRCGLRVYGKTITDQNGKEMVLYMESFNCKEWNRIIRGVRLKVRIDEPSRVMEIL